MALSCLGLMSPSLVSRLPLVGLHPDSSQSLSASIQSLVGKYRQFSVFYLALFTGLFLEVSKFEASGDFHLRFSDEHANLIKI